MPETPEEYAKTELTNYLVAKGIDRTLARSVVEKNVTQFTHIDAEGGGKRIMVLWESRGVTCWPTFNRGFENPHAQELADALLLEARDEMRQRQRRGVVTEELGSDAEQPTERDREMAARVRGSL